MLYITEPKSQTRTAENARYAVRRPLTFLKKVASKIDGQLIV